MLFYEPKTRDKAVLPHDPFKALIAPRPIGWVTTMAANGAINLAPYSFFNAVGDAPPLIAFSSSGTKDSLTFAQETRQFVWNMPTFELREAMNQTAAALPRGESEADFAHLAMAPIQARQAAARRRQSGGVRMRADRRPAAARPARRADVELAGDRRGRGRAHRSRLHQGGPGRHDGDAADRPLRLRRLPRGGPAVPDGSAAAGGAELTAKPRWDGP